MPRVSICIPTYNRAGMLGETLETIRNQRYTDFELVIVDNASTDDTEGMIGKIRDPRLRYVRNPHNVGLILNQNRCIEEARGEFVAIYHDHDFYHPDLVKRSVELFDKHSSVGVVCCSVQLIDPAHPDQIISTQKRDWTERTPGKTMRRELLHRWDSRIPAPTAMVRKVCYEQCGVFQAEFGGGADRELWLRILRKWDLGYISDVLARLRERPRGAPVQDARADAQGAEHWKQLTGQVRIQKVHLEEDFACSPLRLAIEHGRLKGTALRELWKWELLMLAKGYRQASTVAPSAFREVGLNWSGALAERLYRSKVAKDGLSTALRAYRKIALRTQ